MYFNLGLQWIYFISDESFCKKIIQPLRRGNSSIMFNHINPSIKMFQKKLHCTFRQRGWQVGKFLSQCHWWKVHRFSHVFNCLIYNSYFYKALISGESVWVFRVFINVNLNKLIEPCDSQIEGIDRKLVNYSKMTRAH